MQTGDFTFLEGMIPRKGDRIFKGVFRKTERERHVLDKLCCPLPTPYSVQ
jgi:hypothetical protein